MERHRIATERIAELEDQRRNRQNKSSVLDRFIREIETRPLVNDEFDEKLWLAAVEKVTIHRDGRLEFVFKDRTCIHV
jgi:site-specific DNA recombinase